VDEGSCCGFSRGVEVQQDCILVVFSRPSGGGLSLDSASDYVLRYFQTSPFDKLRAGSTGLSAEYSRRHRSPLLRM
jgi:hypothetical protein